MILEHGCWTPKSAKRPPQQVSGQVHLNVDLPAVAIASNGHGRERTMVTCAVSELAMDRIWTRLTAQEKAQLLFPQETEAPAPEKPHA